jgi:hypothetical protein
LAPAELEVNVRARLAKPNRSIRSPQLDKAQPRFQHVHDRFKMPGVKAVGCVVELHHCLHPRDALVSLNGRAAYDRVSESKLTQSNLLCAVYPAM